MLLPRSSRRKTVLEASATTTHAVQRYTIHALSVFAILLLSSTSCIPPSSACSSLFSLCLFLPPLSHFPHSRFFLFPSSFLPFFPSFPSFISFLPKLIISLVPTCTYMYVRAQLVYSCRCGMELICGQSPFTVFRSQGPGRTSDWDIPYPRNHRNNISVLISLPDAR